MKRPLIDRLREGQRICASVGLEDASIYKEAGDRIEQITPTEGQIVSALQAIRMYRPWGEASERMLTDIQVGGVTAAMILLLRQER